MSCNSRGQGIKYKKIAHKGWYKMYLMTLNPNLVWDSSTDEYQVARLKNLVINHPLFISTKEPFAAEELGDFIRKQMNALYTARQTYIEFKLDIWDGAQSKANTEIDEAFPKLIAMVREMDAFLYGAQVPSKKAIAASTYKKKLKKIMQNY